MSNSNIGVNANIGSTLAADLAVNGNDIAVVNSRRLQVGGIQAGAVMGQVVHLPEGIVTTDEFIKMRNEILEWKRIKGIIDAHQIIDDLPDGDIVIRVKRKVVENAAKTGEAVSPAYYKVDFGEESK